MPPKLGAFDFFRVPSNARNRPASSSNTTAPLTGAGRCDRDDQSSSSATEHHHSLLASCSSTLSIRDRIIAQSNGPSCNMLENKARIMKIAFDTSSGVCVDSMEFSLHCPYSMLRMTVPVRSSACQHVQCCDIDSWVTQFSKFRAMRDPVVPCPVCHCRVALSSLQVDHWIALVLKNLQTAKLVVLDQNGTYRSGDATRLAIKRQREEEIIETQASQPRTDDNPDGFDMFEPAVYDEAAEEQDEGGSSASPCIAVKEEPNTTLTTALAVFGAYPREDETATKTSLPHGEPGGHEDPLMVKNEALHMFHSKNIVVDPPSATTTGTGTTTTNSSLARLLATKPLVTAAGGYIAIDHFFSRKHNRLVPASWRHWNPYCPSCRHVCSRQGNDELVDGIHYESERTEYACLLCGQKRTRAEWPIFRRFSFPVSTAALLRVDGDEAGGGSLPHAPLREPPSIEITEDETTILCGVALLDRFLIQGGFFRSAPPKATSTSQSEVKSLSLSPVVWFTSEKLSKLELDFLDNACGVMARGEDPNTLDVRVPLRFRYRKGSSATGGGGPMFTQASTPTTPMPVTVRMPQQQQQQQEQQRLLSPLSPQQPSSDPFSLVAATHFSSSSQSRSASHQRPEDLPDASAGEDVSDAAVATGIRRSFRITVGR